jgi:hypothetical protein
MEIERCAESAQMHPKMLATARTLPLRPLQAMFRTKRYLFPIGDVELLLFWPSIGVGTMKQLFASSSIDPGRAGRVRPREV